MDKTKFKLKLKLINQFLPLKSIDPKYKRLTINKLQKEDPSV